MFQKLIKTANNVVRLVANPCDVPLTVYAKTALPAAGTAMLTYMSFGISDVLRGYARPKLAKGGKRYRKKQGRRVKVGGKWVYLQIPEAGELIGKKLRGADFNPSRIAGAGESALWIMDGVAQRALWFLMVADIINDFAYEWTSSLIPYVCDDYSNNLPRGLGMRFNTANHLGPGNRQVNADVTRYATGITSLGSGHQWRVTEGRFMIVYKVTFQGLGPVYTFRAALYGLPGTLGQPVNGEWVTAAYLDACQSVVTWEGNIPGPYIDLLLYVESGPPWVGSFFFKTLNIDLAFFSITA